MTAQMLPCPFCGSTNVDPEGWMSVNADGTQKKSGPACDDCGGSTDTVERWNNRCSAGSDGTLSEALEPFIKAAEIIASRPQDYKDRIASIGGLATAADLTKRHFSDLLAAAAHPAPPAAASVREAGNLIRMVRSLLRFTNPFYLAEDHSQQWQAVEHQCDVVERALSKPAPAAPKIGRTDREGGWNVARSIDVAPATPTREEIIEQCAKVADDLYDDAPDGCGWDGGGETVGWHGACSTIASKLRDMSPKHSQAVSAETIFDAKTYQGWFDVERAKRIGLQGIRDDLANALRMQDAAEEYHVNCEECEGEGVPELCPACFPLFDEARIERRRLLNHSQPQAETADSDPFNRKQVEAICRAVCKVEGVDPDDDVYGDGCDQQWTRYADAVAEALQPQIAEPLAWMCTDNFLGKNRVEFTTHRYLAEKRQHETERWQVVPLYAITGIQS